MKQRVNSIDIARGMAMVMVILQHCGAFSQFILSFHMPLFFIVSGLVLTKSTPSRSFFCEVGINAKRLLIPQIMLGMFECIFIIISTLYYEHRFELLGGGGVILRAIFRWWFLLVLFQCRVLLWLMKRYVFGSKIKEIISLVFLLGLSIAVYFMPNHLKMLPLYSYLVPISLLFILVGLYFKDYLLKDVKTKDSVVMCLLLVATIISSQVNSRVFMYGAEFGNLLLFFISSLCGSFFFIKLSQVIYSEALKWIGMMCLPIYVLQFHIMQYCKAAEAILLDAIGCQDEVIKTTVLSLFTMFACIIIAVLISKNRVTRFLFGLTNSKLSVVKQ